MAKKVELIKKSDSGMMSYYPKTSADNVLYDEDTTVADVIKGIIDEIKHLEEVLCLNTVYIETENGNVVTDDDGTGLVAVAALRGNTE